MAGLTGQMPTSAPPGPGLGIRAAAADERLVALAQNGDHAALDAQATGAVTRHTRICPNCRRMLANLTRTVSGLRALRDLPSASDLAHRRDRRTDCGHAARSRRSTAFR